MKTTFLLFVLIALVGYNVNCSGQTQLLPQGYQDWYIGDFRCDVYIPPSYNPAKKYPLVIYLHGKSDTVSRNIGWYHEPAVMADPCIVISPKCPLSQTGEWGNSLTSEDPPMIKKTFEMIALLKKQYNLDEKRFYIYGISMGAIGTFGLIQKHPNLFAGGYAVCGWGNPEIAPQLARIPFWLFHGDLDDVVPVEGSRGVYKAVLAHGGKQIRYTEFKGVKHDAWSHLNDNKIITWLLAQKKGIVAGLPTKVAGMKAKVKEDNKILLEWAKPAQASTSNNTIWYYKIYRNKRLIAEVDSDLVAYTDSLATAKSVYEYQLSTVNYAFQESDLSGTARVATSQK